MDSSFLTLVTLGLGAYSVFAFCKMIVQFGLPNHPKRFKAYLVSLCLVIFLVGKSATSLNLFSPWLWMKWAPLPLVAGALGLLIQTIMTIASISLVQQKIISRIPIIAGLLCFAFFPTYAVHFFVAAVAAGCLCFLMPLNKARYQKRLYFKMVLFLGLTGALRLTMAYWPFVIGECLLFFAVFYFFLFQRSICISALIEEGVEE